LFSNNVNDTAKGSKPRTKYNMSHSLFILDNKDYKQTMRMFNTNSFLTITTVRRTNFNVWFLSTLPIFYSLFRNLNQNSISISSRYQLIQFLCTTTCSSDPE